MLKAVDETTTNKLPAYSELTPVACEYVAADEVLVSMRTKSGGLLTYTMKTAMLVHSVNLAVGLINSYSAQVFRDLDVF